VYQNIFVENRYSDEPTVHLWDSKEGYNKFDFPDYAFVRNEYGDYDTMWGNPVMKIPKQNLSYSKKEELNDTYGEDAIHESDVPIETRILVDLYDENEISDGHRHFFYDIEVSSEGGFPNVEEADKKITSLAYSDQASDRQAVLILDEDDSIQDPHRSDIEIHTFNRERELLEAILKHWREADPTIISGWNIDFFDNPYLYRRIKKVLDEDKADRLSPIGEVRYHKNRERFTFAGISSLDYLQIYKNFTFSEQPSYSLDYISNDELDRGKVEYEGIEVNGETITDLDDLKRLDPDRFIDYNFEDVQLVVDIDEKLNFIEMARRISHLGHVPYEDVYMSSRFIEGAILNRLHKKGVVAPNNERGKTTFKAKGRHRFGAEEIQVQKDRIHDDIPKQGMIGVDKASTKTKREKVEYTAIEGDKFILKNQLDFEVDDGGGIGLEFAGAYVKEPNAGTYEWIYDLDLTSMYPCIIMGLNVSPETKVAKIYDWGVTDFAEEPDKDYDVWMFDQADWKHFDSPQDLEHWANQNNYSVAANGAVYRNDKRGIIAEILEDWFDNRQEYKAKRNEARERGDEEEAEYYDKQQHNRKILINCFTPDHEIMTKRGVKNIENVEVGEKVYSIDPETGETEYKRVTRTYEQEDYQGEICKFENSFVDFSVTPNHDMLFGEDRNKVKAENTFENKKRYRIPQHSPFTGNENKVHISLKDECDRLDIEYKYDEKTDKLKEFRQQARWIDNTYSIARFLKLSGWYVSEGSLYKSEKKEYEETVRGESYKIHIANNTESERELIRNLLNEMNLNYYESDKGFSISNKLLYKIFEEDFGNGSYNKKLPDWIWELSGEKLKNLLKTMYLGDGDKRDSRYSTVSEKLAEDFVQLSYHCGYRAGIRNKDDGCYRIALYDRSRGCSPVIKDDQREKVEYEGSIVCVEVEDNHTVLAGRNGKFNWTGQSVYGVLGLPVFRFYDIDNAEATTATGVSTIKFTSRMGDHYYKKHGNPELGQLNECIYTDTDSVFYSAIPLLDFDYKEAEDDRVIEATIEKAKELQGYLNSSYDYYARKMLNIPEGQHRFDIKQELVASRGLWMEAKKRYAYWIVNDEGDPTSELGVKGMDIVRSDFPPAFDDVMEEVIVTILKENDQEKVDQLVMDFEDKLHDFDLIEVANPTGVGEIDEYQRDTLGQYGKGAPVYFKSALAYNDLLEHFDLTDTHEKIREDSKIKWVYLHENPLGLDQVGFKGEDDPEQIMEFAKQYADYDKMYEKALKSKLEDIYDAVGWDFPSAGKRRAEEFFQFS